VNGGWEWEYLNIWGSLFATFHIMSIIMQVVMAEKVFYSVPHHLGYFHDEALCDPKVPSIEQE